MSRAPILYTLFDGNRALHLLMPLCLILPRRDVAPLVKACLLLAWYLIFYVFKHRRWRPRGAIDLDEMDDEQFCNYFRFYREDIALLCCLFDLEPIIRLPDGSRLTARECVLILLLRLRGPATWATLRWVFGRPQSVLSLAYHYTMRRVLDRYGRHLYCNRFLWNRVGTYARTISTKLGLPNGRNRRPVGFLDSTFRFCCRPVRNQRRIYNGWKKGHGWKHQGVIAPDGLFMHFYGPISGRRNDNKVLRASGLRRILHQYLLPWNYFLYADSGYAYNIPCILRCRSHHPDRQMREVYRLMNKVRVSVEWGFGRVLNLWNFVAFKYAQRSLQTRPGRAYRCAVLLTNIYHCLYYRHNPVARYFQCPPPSVFDYLNHANPTAADLQQHA